MRGNIGFNNKIITEMKEIMKIYRQVYDKYYDK